MSETLTRTPTVTLRETDLFSVYCHALESGEWRQIRKRLMDGGNGRCAWGVAAEIAGRAGASPRDVVSYPIDWRAGELLGSHQGIAGANDAGHSFTLIAAALRRARIDLETQGDS